MWIRCYECAKEVYLGWCEKVERNGQTLWYNKPKDEYWHLDIYQVQERDKVLDTNQLKKCDKCGVSSPGKWGHPSMKIFLCGECYNKKEWIG